MILVARHVSFPASVGLAGRGHGLDIALGGSYGYIDMEVVMIYTLGRTLDRPEIVGPSFGTHLFAARCRGLLRRADEERLAGHGKQLYQLFHASRSDKRLHQVRVLGGDECGNVHAFQQKVAGQGQSDKVKHAEVGQHDFGEVGLAEDAKLGII